MKRFRGFLPLLFLVVFGVSGHAQDLTVFGGFQHPGAISLQSALGGAAGAANQALNDAKDFGVFGARVRHGGPVGVEHTVAFSPNFVSSDARAFIANTNLFAELPAPVVRPYATVGIGLVHASGDGPAALGSKFALNYGGGVKLTVLGPAGLRFDVRGYSIRNAGDRTLKVLETSVGIFFSF